ncbi:hypothetical protein D1007_57022 [Hordeum vulgare]|nr:hypothetical protein D1007_57022 [Hordeum vulgare]
MQFECLADRNKAIHHGPWDFKGMALVIAEYDVFTKPELVKLDRIETWCQIHTLPDMVLKRENFVKAMAARIGEALELQIVFPNGFVGEFVRARVRLDINKKLTQFVSFTKAGQTDFYEVKFEKLPVFYYKCGLLGHLHEECRTGEHDTDNMECGRLFYLPRGGVEDVAEARVAVLVVLQTGIVTREMSLQLMTQSWRFNAKNPTSNVAGEGDGSISRHEGNKEDMLSLGKRSTVDSASLALQKTSSSSNSGAIVPTGNTTVMVDQFEASQDQETITLVGTLQTNANRKKLRNDDGVAVDSSS